MTKNTQQQNQIDTKLPGFTDTELGQELANIHQEVSQLIQTVSQFQNSPQGAQANQASNLLKQQMKKADQQSQQEETPNEKHNIRDYDRAWEDDRL
ncbi:MULTISPECIES: hypothetical protein [Peribacillus]|uniref:hypothetical protein n=1 Tax=Peribacillus TaxID=2675229 RepID=UPI002041454F|nr:MULTISPECIES: hypothetical protein [Peribacillus]MCM3676882.1 hypothetical protein [Peribacillus simplex]MDQ0879311.1 hypothetical protein [Peribacillus sp. V2I11]